MSVLMWDSNRVKERAYGLRCTKYEGADIAVAVWDQMEKVKQSQLEQTGECAYGHVDDGNENHRLTDQLESVGCEQYCQ